MPSRKKLLYTTLPIVAGLAIGVGILIVNPNAGQRIGDLIYSKGVSIESYAYAVNKAAPSVVNIYVTELNSDYTSPNGSEVISSASGVIISSQGYIVTNYHVVPSGNEPNHAIWAQTRDGQLYQAFVVGCDRRTDLALLKIEASKLTAIELESKDPQVGDIVLAIGNPNNLGQTVTHGIVSAVARSGSGLLSRDQMNIRQGIQDLIQTDAPINNGNSGGALINTAGNLVGVNTASFNGYQTYGIGFAVPTKMVKYVSEEIKKHGRVVRGYLGIADDENISLGEKLDGVRVGYVDPHGPASGLIFEGDVIVQVNNSKISTVKELIEIISNSKPNTTLSFKIQRNQEVIDVNVSLTEDATNID